MGRIYVQSGAGYIDVSNATQQTAGQESAADKTKLDNLATIWDTPLPSSNITTNDATVTLASTFNVPLDGVIAIWINICAATADGSSWGVWVIAQAIFARVNGVLSLIQGLPSPQAAQVSAGAGAGWNLITAINGTKIQFSLQGSAGATVKWSMHIAANYNQTVDTF